jgi:hypothetical protein
MPGDQAPFRHGGHRVEKHDPPQAKAAMPPPTVAIARIWKGSRSLYSEIALPGLQAK